MIDPQKDEALIATIRERCGKTFPHLGQCTYPNCNCLGIPLDEIAKRDEQEKQNEQ